MCDKDVKETTRNETTAGCGCAQTDSAHSCPCNKRICLPMLGLAGLAVVISLAAKRRNRK